MNIGAAFPFPINQSQAVAKPESGEAANANLTEKATKAPSSEAQVVKELSEQDLKTIQDLKARDREVRAHEAAHLAAAGAYAVGGATYSYQRGPDGVQYAVGGEVNIDTSAIAGNPQATLEKAQRIQAAAFAPAQPSSQDIRVAAQAAQLAVQARAEISQGQSAEAKVETINNTKSSDESDTETDITSKTDPSDDSANAITRQQAQIIANSSISANDNTDAVLDLIA